MAIFTTKGLEEVIKEMKRMGQLSGDVAKEMLMVGAEEVKTAWTEAANKHGHLDTGEMIRSIDYSREVKTADEVLYVDIYPQGKYKNGQRRAEIAFILNYGTSKIPASRWVDDADRASLVRVSPAMIKVWDRFIESNGAK